MKLITRNVGFLFLLSAAFLFFLPTIILPYSLIDDWETLKVTEEATTALLSGNFTKVGDLFIEISYGRFRLGYWIYQWTFTTIFQQNPALNHLGRIFVLLLTLGLTFWITQRLTRSKAAAFLAGFLFLFFGPSVENWIRLGPAEVPLLLFSLASFASIIFAWEKKSPNWTIASFLFLGLAYSTKETAIMLLPASAFLFLAVSGEKREFAKGHLAANSVFAVLLFILVLTMRTNAPAGYSANYLLEVNEILSHLNQYLEIFIRGYNLLWLFFLTSFAYRLLIKRQFGKVERLQLFFLVWFLGGFVFQLPWRFVLGRYLLPISAPLAMFLASEVVIILKRLSKKTLISAEVGLGLLFLLVAAQGLVDGLTFFLDVKARDGGHHQALSLITGQVPQDGRLFVNFSQNRAAVEWMFGLRTNLALVYNRPDIVVVQLEAGQPYQRGDYILDWSANREYDVARLSNILPAEARIVEQIQTFGVTPGPSLAQAVLVPTKGKIAAAFGTPFAYEWTIFAL